MDTEEKEIPVVEVTSTMDISVKTLDSRTHQFNDLDSEITVPEFKAHISETVGVTAEQQRLIFRGRVLQDDKKLKDYNVASGQVIHLVTRTNSSTANDQPPPNVTVGQGQGGQNIMNMIGPLGNVDWGMPGGSGVTQSTVRRRNSAAVRLQVANENLTRASGMLKTLEEEIVLLEQEAAAQENQGQGRETPSFSEELDSALGASLGGPTAAALVATISESSGGGNAESNQQSQAAASQPRIPAPMLQELATSIEDYLSLNSRLTPFLLTLQRWLRENAELAEHQRNQVQYTYDTLSSILHSLAHTLHAVSDITIDFSLTPENRRLRAPPSILVGQSTVVRAAIPIGIGIEGLPIQVTSTSTSSVNFNPPLTTQNTSNQNQTQPTPSGAFQGGSIRFPGGFQFGGGLAQGGGSVQIGPNLVGQGQTQNRAQGGQDMGMGLQQAIAAALQAFNRPNGGGVMLGPFSSSVPNNPNIRIGSNVNVSGQTVTVNAAPTPPTDATANSTSTSTPSPAPPQTNNSQPSQQDHFRSLLGSLSPQHRPFDLLLQCRSHHHLQRGQEHRPERPDGLVSFLSEQRGLKENEGENELESIRMMQTFFGLLQIVNPLRPVIAQYIRSTLLRGRDPSNRSHVSTAVRLHARRLATWLIEPLKLTNDEETINKLSRNLIDVFTEFFSQCVEVILNESTDPTLLTSNFTRLIGEQMPRVRAIFQEAFGHENYSRVLRGLVLMVVNFLFPQSSLIFRTQITRVISGILETANYIPDDGEQEEGPEEEHADMEIDIDVTLGGEPEQNEHQEEPVPQVATTVDVPVPAQEPPQPVVVTNHTPVPVNDEAAPHSESDLSDLETEFETATNELFQNVPGAWRNCLLRDIERQVPLREAGPEPLSNEFVALFPQK